MGGIVEENLSAIKLIVSFANEHLSFKKFEEKAKSTREISLFSNIMLSIINGIVRFLIIGFNAYGFWVGSVFIHKEINNPS